MTDRELLALYAARDERAIVTHDLQLNERAEDIEIPDLEHMKENDAE